MSPILPYRRRSPPNLAQSPPVLLGDLISLPSLLTTESPIRRPTLPRPLSLVASVSSPLPTMDTTPPNLLLISLARGIKPLVVFLPLTNSPSVVLRLVPRSPQKDRPKLLTLGPVMPLMLVIILPSPVSTLLPASPRIGLIGPLEMTLLVGALAAVGLEILVVPPLLLNLIGPLGRPALRALATAPIPPEMGLLCLGHTRS